MGQLRDLGARPGACGVLGRDGLMLHGDAGGPAGLFDACHRGSRRLEGGVLAQLGHHGDALVGGGRGNKGDLGFGEVEGAVYDQVYPARRPHGLGKERRSLSRFDEPVLCEDAPIGAADREKLLLRGGEARVVF